MFSVLFVYFIFFFFFFFCCVGLFTFVSYCLQLFFLHFIELCTLSACSFHVGFMLQYWLERHILPFVWHFCAVVYSCWFCCLIFIQIIQIGSLYEKKIHSQNCQVNGASYEKEKTAFIWISLVTMAMQLPLHQLRIIVCCMFDLLLNL